MTHLIDINCDMGESYGAYIIGNDEKIMPLVSSTNIACGFHGGDPVVMEQTIRLALAHGVRIGAHPGYPDLAGFGRRRITMKSAELKAAVKYQVSALSGMARSLGGKVEYVKPHGALYNTSSEDENECRVVAEAIVEIDPNLHFMGLANSLMQGIAKEHGLNFIAEGFADRRYEPNGQLMSRAKPGAVIMEADVAMEQVLQMVLKGTVTTSDGTELPLRPDSICIHGDNPSAEHILQSLKSEFKAHKITMGR